MNPAASRAIVSLVSGVGTSDVRSSFFFQAEDGIRDRDVTGVQTCALPIYLRGRYRNTYFFIQQPQKISITITPPQVAINDNPLDADQSLNNYLATLHVQSNLI